MHEIDWNGTTPLTPADWIIRSLGAAIVGGAAGVVAFGTPGLLGAIPGLVVAWGAYAAATS